jgi:hypothetical protein
MRAYNDLDMRRGMAIAAFALMLAVPLWAQHGGGGGHGGGGFGGGHSGGLGGGHAGAFSGGGRAGGFSHSGSAGHGFSGSPTVHAYSGPLSDASRGYSHLPSTFGFSHPPTGGFTPPTSPLVRQPFASNGFAHFGVGRGGVHIHIRSYPYWGWGGYGWGWGYPFWGWSYFNPWWWDSGDDGYDGSGYDNNAVTAQQMNEDNLRQQDMLRQEQMDGDQDAYQNAYNQGYVDAQAQSQQGRNNQSPNVRPPLDPERLQEAERHPTTDDSHIRPTVLVFRDQHKQEIENYAIVGDTLWNFAPQETVKIPLSNLDIPATVKANQDRGLTFSVPDSDEGQ